MLYAMTQQISAVDHGLTGADLRAAHSRAGEAAAVLPDLRARLASALEARQAGYPGRRPGPGPVRCPVREKRGGGLLKLRPVPPAEPELATG